MMIHEQRLTTALRWLPDGGKYGEPYTYAAVLLWHSPDCVEIVAVMQPPSLNQTRQLVQWLRDQGVKSLIRRKGLRAVHHDLTKKNDG